MLNVNKYLPLYAKGAQPQFMEGNPFVTVIALPPESRKKDRMVREGASQKQRARTTQKTTQKTADRILALIRQDRSITTQAMAAKLRLTLFGIRYHLTDVPFEI